MTYEVTTLTLFEELQRDRLAARKSGERVKADLLGTVIAEASKEFKQPSDDHVIKILRKFQTSIQQMIEYDQTTSDFVNAKLDEEYKIVTRYLPSRMTEENIISVLKHEVKVPVIMKNMKVIKELFDSLYPGQAEGSLIAKVVKEWQS